MTPRSFWEEISRRGPTAIAAQIAVAAPRCRKANPLPESVSPASSQQGCGRRVIVTWSLGVRNTRTPALMPLEERSERFSTWW